MDEVLGKPPIQGEEYDDVADRARRSVRVRMKEKDGYGWIVLVVCCMKFKDRPQQYSSSSICSFVCFS